MTSAKLSKKAIAAKKTASKKAPPEVIARERISQQDVPSMSLERALKVARAIGDQYGYKPVTPVQLAQALEMQTTSGPFRTLAGASIAYGLIKGGYNAEAISIEILRLRIIRPTAEDESESAKREAVLKPRIVREFLTKYSGAAIPREDIAKNVLATLGVPADRCGSVLVMITENAQAVGFLADIKGRKYIDLAGFNPADRGSEDEDEVLPAPQGDPTSPLPFREQSRESDRTLFQGDSHRARRVFITHGKNIAFVDPIKKLLTFGELEAVVSVERQSVSQPVPDKVMSDMRSCGAAIVHVEDEVRLLDKDAKEHILLNSNVLIEIGACLALYGRRFILLVREGVTLPSNLQGLYRVRYSGEQMDSTATIKLLEAIRDIKNHPLPDGSS